MADEDPIAALGGALSSFVEGVGASQAPDPLKQEAAALLEQFNALVSKLTGGEAEGPQGQRQATSMDPMAGGSKGARPIA